MAIPKGILQRKGTQLMKNGVPFHEISFNKFDLLWQYLNNYDKPLGQKAAIEALDWLKDHGFSVIRSAFCPYHADGYRDVFFDESAAKQKVKRHDFFAKASEVINECEQRGISIVATLAWNWEAMAQLGNQGFQQTITQMQSPGKKMIQEYIVEVVGTFASQSGIAMWEIDNEWNLNADLRQKEPIGYAFSSSQLGAFYRDTALLIKSVDPYHLVTTGDSSPRPCAWHLYSSQAKLTGDLDWKKDTEAELLSYLTMTNPEPIDVISVHYYDEAMEALDRQTGNVDNMALYKRLADKLGRPLMVGEVGPPQRYKDKKYTAPNSIQLVKDVCRQAQQSKIPLTLFWSFCDDRNPLTGSAMDYEMRPDTTPEALDIICSAQKRYGR